MDHILGQIFGYLDYYCLRQAELVSLAWQEAILYGKIWMKLLKRNVRICCIERVVNFQSCSKNNPFHDKIIRLHLNLSGRKCMQS